MTKERPTTKHPEIALESNAILIIFSLNIHLNVRIFSVHKNNWTYFHYSVITTTGKLSCYFGVLTHNWRPQSCVTECSSVKSSRNIRMVSSKLAVARRPVNGHRNTKTRYAMQQGNNIWVSVLCCWITTGLSKNILWHVCLSLMLRYSAWSQYGHLVSYATSHSFNSQITRLDTKPYI